MLTAGRKRPGGYAHWTNGAIGVPDLELDTFTCRHCNTVVAVQPFQDPAEAGGWCFNCSALICKDCAGKDCRPFERELERIEKIERLERQIQGYYR